MTASVTWRIFHTILGGKASKPWSGLDAALQRSELVAQSRTGVQSPESERESSLKRRAIMQRSEAVRGRGCWLCTTRLHWKVFSHGLVV